MPITAETFKVEHFEKLERGLAVAREAYAALVEDRDSQERARHELEEVIGELDVRIAGLKDREGEAILRVQQWYRLLEFIADVERGVRSANELFVLAREQNA